MTTCPTLLFSETRVSPNVNDKLKDEVLLCVLLCESYFLLQPPKNNNKTLKPLFDWLENELSQR